MSFDVSLPFVSKVYDHVRNGELDECATWLADFIRSRPTTRIHCILDHNFDQFLPEYSDWLFNACDTHPKLDSSVAICTSMGEFEINYNHWRTDAVAYTNYDGPTDPYEWLAESDGCVLADWFDFTGLDVLSDAFAHADDYNDLDPDAQSPYPSDVFTAACYLFFNCFLQLNRQTHRLARESGHGFARVHLFCYYGDCLYHSPPQTDGE